MRRQIVVVALAMSACVLGPSDVTFFNPREVSPPVGSVLNTRSGATIKITGELSVQERMYYTMVYVRNDGRVFMGNTWGPSNDGSDR